MEPNDLPIVCIPLELPAEAAAELLEFLSHLTETPSNGITSASCIGSLRSKVRRIVIPTTLPSTAQTPIRRSDSNLR
jgi:hypothetical protein